MPFRNGIVGQFTSWLTADEDNIFNDNEGLKALVVVLFNVKYKIALEERALERDGEIFMVRTTQWEEIEDEEVRASVADSRD
jgi:hypothetical protein